MTGMEPRQFVEVLLEGSGCQPGDYQMGQDMVFFKGSKGAVLQELMLTPKEELAGKILASLKQTDPKHASIPQLEQYIAQRLEERKAAKEKLINAFFALHAMFGWNEAYKQIKLEKKAAATRMQAAQRGKLARKEIEEMKATGKEMEIRDLNVDEAPADVEFHIEAGLAKKSAGHAELDEEAQEAAEHEAKWFVTEPRTGRRYHRFLMCKGVEWGFQYHNFYGDWELSQTEPLNNGRPHYVHNTMYGGHAHLFHTIDPHYHVPRWVIGPSPGNENGWAFCESDAPTPHEVNTKWISWDGFEWHSCKDFRYVSKEHELDGLSDEEDFLEDDEDDELFTGINFGEDSPAG